MQERRHRSSLYSRNTCGNLLSFFLFFFNIEMPGSYVQWFWLSEMGGASTCVFENSPVRVWFPASIENHYVRVWSPVWSVEPTASVLGFKSWLFTLYTFGHVTCLLQASVCSCKMEIIRIFLRVFDIVKWSDPIKCLAQSWFMVIGQEILFPHAWLFL